MNASLDRLRELCGLYWNPIGVPMRRYNREAVQQSWYLPEDEYDRYLLRALEMARAGQDAPSIIRYLEWVEEEHMQIPHPDGDKKVFVDHLLAFAK